MMIYYESTELHIQARRLKTREHRVYGQKKTCKNVQIKIKNVEKRKKRDKLKKTFVNVTSS